MNQTQFDPMYTREELTALGFSEVSETCQVSRHSSFDGVSGRLGKSVRIGAFCVLRGHLELGDQVSIANFCELDAAHAPIRMEDCSALEENVSLFTGIDDPAANGLPLGSVDASLSKALIGPVTVGRGASVGAFTVVMPGLRIGDAAAVASHCLITKAVPDGAVIINASARTMAFGKKDVGKILAAADTLMSKSRPA